MDDLTIKIGGHSRPVRLTAADGATLQKHYGFKSPAQWLVNEVLGVDFEGHFGAYNLTAQFSVIALGINRATRNQKDPATETKVAGWVDDLHEEIAAGTLPQDAFKEVLWTVVEAAFRAGWVMGHPYDIRKELDQVYRLFFGLKEGETRATENASTAPQLDTLSTVRAAE